MADNNTVILRVQLSEEDTEKKLQSLVLDIEATKKAQAELTAARKAGQLTDEQYAQQTVALRTQLRGQQDEQRALSKTLDQYRAAMNGTTGSIDQMRAQLGLATAQVNALSDAERNSEGGQVLVAQVKSLSDALKEAEQANGDFRRNVGNYPKSDGLEQLVQQLVTLQEQQKRATAGSQEAAEVTRQIGFVQQAAAQAGAKQGKSYEETTSFIEGLSSAIRPATVQLLDLTEAQQAAAESGEATGEAAQQIGFKIGAAQKAIKDATDALKQQAAAAEDSAEESKSLAGGLKEVAGENSLVSVATEKYSAAKTKFTQVSNLAKLAIGGEVSALGLLRLAIIATGLGALVVVLGSVVTFLTKTAEGTKLVENVMAQAGAVVNVVVDRLGALGKAVVQVLSGDFAGAGATAKAALSGIGDEVVREVKLAGDLSKAQQQLNRDRQANADTNKRLLRDEENLKNIRDDESKSLAVRRKANEDAFTVEQKREAILVDLARRQLAIYQQQVAARGGRAKADQELLDKLAESEAELADVQEDAAGRRNEYITNRNSLLKDSADKEKELAEKTAERTIQLRKDALALEAVLLDRQLKAVQAGSDQELSLLQQKLRNGYQAELNVKNLTVSAKKVIDAKYESDSQALLVSAIKARALAAYDAELSSVQAELALAEKGTQQETELRVEAINVQLQQQLAALDKRADNEARANLLRANAEKAINDTRYAAAQTSLEKYLQGERNALDESYARGKLAEADYNKAILVSDVTAAASRLELARSFKQETAQLDQQLTTAKIANIERVAEKEKAEQAKRVALAEQLAGGLASLFSEYAATQGATLADFSRKALILLIDGLEKQIIADQIKIISQAFASAESLATFGIAGFAKAAAIIGLVTAATEGLKSQLTPTSSQFAQGTVLGGASHAHGGTQLFGRNGHWYGEAEAGEAVINKRSTALFLPVLSAINQVGGGRALLPNLNIPRMALGGMTYPALAQQQALGAAGQPIDYERLAQAMSRVNIEAKISAIEKAAKQKAIGIRVSND